nr:hypothetical protein [uncultured Desulfobacter sp.]
MKSQNSRRRFFKFSIVAFAASTLTLNKPDKVAASGFEDIINVGPNGDAETIAEALSIIKGLSQNEAYFVISLSPGIHELKGVNDIPRYVSIIGSGQESTIIDCIGNWGSFKVRTGQTYKNFSIRANRNSEAAIFGMFYAEENSREVFFKNVNIYLTGGYTAALYFSCFSTVKMNNVNIWTTNIGIKATGYIYLQDCHVRLSGDGTGTSYYGLTCFSGNKTPVRYYVTGGFFGVGYGTTEEEGFGANGFSILNDGDQEVIVFYIPADHQAKTQTGSRFQLTGVECYVRNEHLSDIDIACNCVRVDGAGFARLYGGLYQSELPSCSHQALAVENTNSGNHSTNGIIEIYSTRISSMNGNISSFSQEPVSILTSDDNGCQLNREDASVFFCDASSGPFKIYLPAVWSKGAPPNGLKIKFIKSDESSNSITIIAPGDDTTIEGEKKTTLTKKYKKISLLYGPMDSNTWFVM